MKTAAYTICRNEIKKIDQWFYYTRDFDYRVILDTGSVDGTYEKLKELSNTESNFILDQLILEDFRFDIPRNYNLNMIPIDVEWCLSPDMDEYFSINVLKEIDKTIGNNPLVTNISCTRLDIYSDKVFVGPPESIGTNKIHKRHLYDWKQPIYEHLSYIGSENELEIFNSEIFLIHDQDISKPRSDLYFRLLKKEFERNPSNSWNSWFLANEYYKKQDLENFVKVGVEFCNYSPQDTKFKEVLECLYSIQNATNVEKEIKDLISKNLKIYK